MSSYRPNAEQSADDGNLESQIADLRLSVGQASGELISQEELEAALEEMANLRLSARPQQQQEEETSGDAGSADVGRSGSFYDNADETDVAHARAVARASASAHQSVRASALARGAQSGTPAGVVQVGLPVPPSPNIESQTHALFPIPMQQTSPLVVASWNSKPNSGKLNKRDMEPLATFLLASVRPAALLLQEPYDFSRLAKTLQLPYRFLPAVGSHVQIAYDAEQFVETPASAAQLKSVLVQVVEEELDDSFWCVPSTSGAANSVKRASSKAPAASASGLDPRECRALLARVLDERTALALLVHVRTGQPFLLASIHFPHTGNTDLQKQVTTFNLLGLLGRTRARCHVLLGADFNYELYSGRSWHSVADEGAVRRVLAPFAPRTPPLDPRGPIDGLVHFTAPQLVAAAGSPSGALSTLTSAHTLRTRGLPPATGVEAVANEQFDADWFRENDCHAPLLYGYWWGMGASPAPSSGQSIEGSNGVSGPGKEIGGSGGRPVRRSRNSRTSQV